MKGMMFTANSSIRISKTKVQYFQ